ncbi:alcohol acetyltransferase [Salinicoccus roseus]|uniref:alcohol acetyltransferase n=1 Tax=Salinicoccus roseus TaxID=45670 RepID=UPI001CA6AD37|nr:alcohol acetyltransferase [Salinicoccus roseus]MBY8908992.1 alcohol acetyltransferase [Salinicoccus roseus]
MDEWYRIDNTGRIFHAVSDATNSSVFRVSMILKERIDPESLQSALDIVAVRFPTLTVRVRKGVFWDFMEHNDERLLVKREKDHPCTPIDRRENNAYLIRVFHYEYRISVEIFHSLTDGGGAMEFLKTLVYQYLIERGAAVSAEGEVLIPEDPPKREEMEDSFERYATSHSVRRPEKRGEKAYQIEGKALDPPGIHVVHGVVDAGALNRYAKSAGTSLTGLLTSLLVDVIHEEKIRQGAPEGNVVIALPISLRRAFPSQTLRNFFSVANIGVTMDGYMKFEDIIHSVTTQLKDKTDPEQLQQGINRFISLQNSLLIRATPVLMKYPIMRIGFNHIGERGKTMTLSNLGNIRLPESMKTHVERMEIILYPTRKSPINCGVGTLNDQLTVTFARSIGESTIIRSFFRRLRQMTGLEVMVYSNRWGEER